MIELRDFISETLKQIIDGVTDAQEYAKSKGSTVSPKIELVRPSANTVSGMAYTTNIGQPLANMIEFDIAITAAESAKTSNEIGAKLITVLGASLQGQSEAMNNTVSRVKFVLPVVLPNG